MLSDEVPLRKAGGRLFFDLTHDLASPIGRKIILSTMGKGDPLMQNAILSLMKRKAFMKSLIKLEGGDAVINSIRAYLKKYGNNGVEAMVEVVGGPIKLVYLKRLVRQDETGIWSVVGYDPR